jgi:hypothetical protein
LLALALTTLSGEGQNPARNSQRSAPHEQLLLRINVDLVQMDVVATDSQGNHIEDLKPEEFEILESGKPQRIANFSFISDARAGMLVTRRETAAGQTTNSEIVEQTQVQTTATAVAGCLVR